MVYELDDTTKAEKLGYELDHEYVVYEVSRESRTH